MTSDQYETNPFVSPPTTQEGVKVVPSSYEIQGDRILGPAKIVLPHACVKCGMVLDEQDGSTRRKKDLYWVHPAIFVLVIQMLIFLIVYFITRKKCRVEYSLCRECDAARRMNHVYCWGGLAVLIGMIALVIHFENAWFSLGIILSFVMMITFAIRANGPLTLRSYKKGEFEIRGAGPQFLDIAERLSGDDDIAAAIVAEDGRLV